MHRMLCLITLALTAPALAFADAPAKKDELPTTRLEAAEPASDLRNNDGDDAVNGTFAGLPEGSIVTVNGVSKLFPLSFDHIFIDGGTGNDILGGVFGHNTLHGDDGTDTFRVRSLAANPDNDFTQGTDTLKRIPRGGGGDDVEPTPVSDQGV